MDKKAYTPVEVAIELKKSLYKMVKKALSVKDKYKEEAQDVVNDVLDPDYVAEVNPKELPKAKENVLWKSKKKGIGKLKSFKKQILSKNKSK